MEDCILYLDIFKEISKWITDGRTWKSLIFTCKEIYRLNTDDKVAKYSNHLWTSIKFFSKKTTASQRMPSGKLSLESCPR